MAKGSSHVEILGMEQVVAMLTDVPVKVAPTIRAALRTIATQAKNEVKAATPVDTGNLKRSIGVVGSKPRGEFYSYRVIARQDGSNTGKGYHYHLVEYGTVKMKARRFAAPIKARYTGGAGSGMLKDAITKQIEKRLAKLAKGK